MATDPQQILQERDRELASIDAKAEWTQEAKESRKQAVREWARKEYEEAREENRREREARLESTRSAVYRVPLGVAPSDAEAAQIHAAFRGA